MFRIPSVRKRSSTFLDKKRENMPIKSRWQRSVTSLIWRSVSEPLLRSLVADAGKYFCFTIRFDNTPSPTRVRKDLAEYFVYQHSTKEGGF
ncbi:hypothetical protein J6590_041261 [Homalodisca vitripennis]|nr:hypothetical protein J6590_041261 [Homalodisca vitripennis]